MGFNNEIKAKLLYGRLISFFHVKIHQKNNGFLVFINLEMARLNKITMAL